MRSAAADMLRRSARQQTPLARKRYGFGVNRPRSVRNQERPQRKSTAQRAQSHRNDRSLRCSIASSAGAAELGIGIHARRAKDALVN
jgi:hypothetical protein